MRSIVGKALLILTVFSIGCGRKASPPTAATPDTSTKPAHRAKVAVRQDEPTEPARFEFRPVQSKELTGVWYGVTRETGVVIQFIGRQSREPNKRGVLSGKWIVHVDRGSIGSRIEFVDNPQSGAVDLEVGMVHNETKETFTASLGHIHRSNDGSLYLSIDKNNASDMYIPAEYIRLQRVTDAAEINPDIIDQMRAACETLQAA